MAVNLSPSQVGPGLAKWVSQALTEQGTAAERLTLEFTENVMVRETRPTVDALEQLRDMGCSVALDDFGTGYSSLSYLVGLPVNILKIDRSFVSTMNESTDSLVVVRTIVQLARSLGLTSVAEGIESDAQAGTLLQLGCDRGQGYRYAKPMALPALMRWLRAREDLPVSPRLTVVSNEADETGRASGHRVD